MNSKRKGTAGENELCAHLTAAGYPAHRNEQRFIGGTGNPDIEAAGLEHLHIECKRVEHLNITEAMHQSEHDAAGRVPVVIHRRNREPWLITMRLSDYLTGAAQPVAPAPQGRGQATTPTPTPTPNAGAEQREKREKFFGKQEMGATI